MDEILEWVNYLIVDPYILRQPTPPYPSLNTSLNVSALSAATTLFNAGNRVNDGMNDSFPRWNPAYSMPRQFLVLWIFTYTVAILLYYIVASITFLYFFVQHRTETSHPHFQQPLDLPKRPVTLNAAHWPFDWQQVKAEAWLSTWSLFVMSGLTCAVELYILSGGGRVYHRVEDYGWLWMLVSPFTFLFVTDCLIYWIHRALHHKWLYGPIHKLHHQYKVTTPFSAFAFHPLDGFAQSIPYHIYALLFPIHSWMYAFVLFGVGLWTVNIHDRVSLQLPWVNCAAHHTVHHEQFYYNYGQYFIWWDYWCGSYRNPMETLLYKAIKSDGEDELKKLK